MTEAPTNNAPRCADIRSRFVVVVVASLVALPAAFVALCLSVGQDLSEFAYGRPAMYLLAASLVCGLALAPMRRIPLPALLVAGPVLTLLAMLGPAILFGRHAGGA